MMKTRYYLLLAATVLLASCQKAFQTPEIVISKGVTTLEVGLPDTKTYLGDAVEGVHKVYWSNGDQIAWNGTASEELTGLDENTASATFTFPGVLSAPMDLLYPASIYTDESHVTLPSVQAYNAKGFAPGMFPMAGHSESAVGGIRLSHLCALVKISIKRAASNPDTDDIVSVRFMGKNSEKVSGNFEINYATPALTAATGTGSELEVRVAQRLSTESTAVYYLVVPARTYTNGFDIIVKDASGDVMEQSKASSWTAVAGKQHNMPAFDFVPTTTETREDVDIANAAQFVQFAQDYNEGTVYAGKTPVVSLSADLDFSEGTAQSDFIATGGIESFSGVLNGNGHSITNLSSTVPLFKSVAAGGRVEYLTVSGSCSFTYTHPSATNDNFGIITKQLKGTLNEVTVEASASLESGTNTKLIDFGGLVGRANAAAARIINCHFNGVINIPSDYSTSSTIRLGGLVGYTTQSLRIENSSFSGTIKCLGGSTYAYSISEPGLMIGGIVGKNQKATIANCSTKDASTKASVTIDKTVYEATILVQNSNTEFVTVGGIVGYNYDGGQISSSCANRASIFDNVTKATENSTLSVGGIVGFNSDNTSVASVSNATNYASMCHFSSSVTQQLGGVVGLDRGNITNCTNETTGKVTMDKGAQNPSVGGVIGEKALGTITGTICNKAAVSVNSLTTGAYGCQLGGVIGCNAVVLNGGDSKTITNSGAVTLTADVLTTGNCGIGGIVGFSSANISGASNGGSVSCTGLHVTKDGNPANQATKNACLGGILGLAESSITVSGCLNTGKIKYQKSQDVKSNQCPSYVGGIVGKMSNGGTISSSENRAGVWNHNFNNSTEISLAPFCGGIVGALVGTDLSAGTISGVSKTGTENNDNFRCRVKRGFVGGIAGYVSYTTVGSDITENDCTSESCIIGISSCYEAGLIGQMVSSSIKRCKFAGGTISNSESVTLAGLVHTMDASSSVEYCIFNGTLNIDGGSIVNTADNGSTISNCQVAGSINGSAITVGDLKIDLSGNATVTGCSLYTP